ncbi:MAG TPA: papain-like cysteine protease family protein [Gemmatales bacterium]|nr:papain-like cysteine protease family protein [Gemmatales bacterium]
MNSSILHNVPILIQKQTWSCWYTSLQMVVKYYRNQGKGGLKDPSEVKETQDLYVNNVGIGGGFDPATERERIAKKLGFTSLYMSLTNEGMWQLIKKGPVIYAGQWPGLSSGHWVVIVGVSSGKLAINNPAIGRQTWGYDQFMGKYLLQTAERPLIYVP